MGETITEDEARTVILRAMQRFVESCLIAPATGKHMRECLATYTDALEKIDKQQPVSLNPWLSQGTKIKYKRKGK